MLSLQAGACARFWGRGGPVAKPSQTRCCPRARALPRCAPPRALAPPSPTPLRRPGRTPAAADPAATDNPLASAEADAVATIAALLSLDEEEEDGEVEGGPPTSSPRPSGLSEADLAALLGAGGSTTSQGFPVMLGLLGKALAPGSGAATSASPSSTAPPPTDPAAALAARRLLSRYDADASGDVSATELAQLVGDTFLNAADPATARLGRDGLRSLFEAAAEAAAGESGALPPVGEGRISDVLARYGSLTPVAGPDGAPAATEMTLTFRGFLSLLRDEVVDLRAVIRFAALGGGRAGVSVAPQPKEARARPAPPPAPRDTLAVAVGSLSSLERLLEEEEEEGEGGAGGEAAAAALAAPAAPAAPSTSIIRHTPGEVTTLRSLSDFDALVAGAGDALVCVQASLTFCRPCRSFRGAVAALAAATPGVVFGHFFGNSNDSTKVLFRDVLKVPLTPGFAFYRRGAKVGPIHTGANAAKLVAALRERASGPGEDPLAGLPPGAEGDLVARMKAGAK